MHVEAKKNANLEAVTASLEDQLNIKPKHTSKLPVKMGANTGYTSPQQGMENVMGMVGDGQPAQVPAQVQAPQAQPQMTPEMIASGYDPTKYPYGNNGVGGASFFVDASDNGASKFKGGNGVPFNPINLQLRNSIYNYNSTVGDRVGYDNSGVGYRNNTLGVPLYMGEGGLSNGAVMPPKSSTEVPPRANKQVPSEANRAMTPQLFKRTPTTPVLSDQPEGISLNDNNTSLNSDAPLGFDNLKGSKPNGSKLNFNGIKGFLKDKSGYISDLGGGMLSIIDNIQNKKMNEKMLAEGVPNPNYAGPVRLNNNVDISAEQAAQQQAMGQANQGIMENTTNSANAVARTSANRISTGANMGAAMTGKYNQENANLNNEILANKDVEQYNLAQLDNFEGNQFALKQKYYDNKSANVANLQDDLTNMTTNMRLRGRDDEILKLERLKYKGGSGVDVYNSTYSQLKQYLLDPNLSQGQRNKIQAEIDRQDKTGLFK